MTRVKTAAACNRERAKRSGAFQQPVLLLPLFAAADDDDAVHAFTMLCSSAVPRRGTEKRDDARGIRSLHHAHLETLLRYEYI